MNVRFGNGCDEESVKSTMRMGNNPMVGATVSVAVAVAEAAKAGKF